MLPCPNPWCDSDSPPFMHHIVSHRDEWAVSCGCGFLGPVLDSPERADAAWNTRAAPKQAEQQGVEREWLGTARDARVGTFVSGFINRMASACDRTRAHRSGDVIVAKRDWHALMQLATDAAALNAPTGAVEKERGA